MVHRLSGGHLQQPNLLALGARHGKPEKIRESRRRTLQIKVRVTPDELQVITENARGCSLTVPEFLRRLGQGYIPKSKLDLIAVRELCKAAGDLGRASGLLKQWIGLKQSGEVLDKVPISSIDAVFRELRIGVTEVKAKILDL